MKLLNKNFMLKQVGNEYMIIPVSNNNVNFSKIFNTNEVGAFIFNNLKDHSKEEVLELLDPDLHKLVLNKKNSNIIAGRSRGGRVEQAVFRRGR